LGIMAGHDPQNFLIVAYAGFSVTPATTLHAFRPHFRLIPRRPDTRTLEL